MSNGIIYGVGVGPGDPELISLKAYNLLKKAKHIAYFKKKDKEGISYKIIKEYLRKDVLEIKMNYPITTEISFLSSQYKKTLSQFYDNCCNEILTISNQNKDLVIICEGDPFFYGSFMHIYTRLLNKSIIKVIPGITGMSAAWTASKFPITWGDDVLTVIMGTMTEIEIVKRIKKNDAIVIMKIGKNYGKICKVLKFLNLFNDAFLVENASMSNERVRKLTDVHELRLPYFSIILLHGTGRRP
jgi:precorrin-2/cobalt-factor-2 C20-methyltransferase